MFSLLREIFLGVPLNYSMQITVPLSRRVGRLAAPLRTRLRRASTATVDISRSNGFTRSYISYEGLTSSLTFRQSTIRIIYYRTPSIS